MIKPIDWTDGRLKVLDQLKLPHEKEWIEVDSVQDCIDIISRMNVRGAPLIGFIGLFGASFIVRDFERESWDEYKEKLISARPTAVNLSYEVNRAFSELEKEKVLPSDAFSFLIELTVSSIEEAELKHQEMASWGEVILKKYVKKSMYSLQTHCNTGRLACGTLGTALGVIEKLGERGQVKKVWVNETRPYLQGSRLTAFELEQMGIAHDIVVEGAASFLMSRGYIDGIFVGADRIAANGDTANKIGTANLGIIAQKYNVPFFVVAPLSSFDFSLPSGRDIQIELRNESEILKFSDSWIAPENSRAFNPSFDITPGELITAIISEKGIVENPSTIKMKEILL